MIDNITQEYINPEISLYFRAHAATVKESIVSIQDASQSYILEYSLSPSDCLFDLEEGAHIVEIELQKSYLEKYRNSHPLIIRKESVCCSVQAKLLEIVDCKLSGIERSLFMESQVLFLVHYLFKNNHLYISDCLHCALSEKPLETEKIQLARKYIQEHLSQKFTIPEIASVVGTNQCYLKKGFKELYGSTIFDFVLENRMHKAEYLLKNSEKKLLEIAELVGYSSLSSFSKAYKNYFGISPSRVEV